ncbi:MAG: YihY/virulence factor BrkB family protein [Rickettsiaceae bacterium]
MTKISNCIYDAIIQTIDHDGIEHAGYMSFMVLLSVFPFLVFFLALTSFIGASDLGKQFVDFLVNNMPYNTTEVIRVRADELTQSPPQSLLTLAIVGSVWTASSFVECMKTILNRAYHITSPPAYIWRRMLSILQFFIISCVISFSMLILFVVPIILKKVPAILELIDGYEWLLYFSRHIFTFVILFFSVSTFYYIIPSIKIKFIEIIPGTLITVFAWIITGYLFSKYLMYYNQLNVVYGSVGSVIVTLIFFYIINIIFIFGAEFNVKLKYYI